MNAPRTPSGRRHRERGAALLLAMVILTLVTTLAAGMVWQQWRAVEVEAASRARSQSEWILIGALDWARLILSEDGRNNRADDLGEPWATPLAESRLSTFLAADRNNNSAADNEGIEAFLSGQIEDAQARYNLRNLVDNTNKVLPAELAIFEKVCAVAGLSPQAAQSLATTLRAAWYVGPGAPNDAPVAPTRVDDLRWLGFDEASLERLRPWVTLLPVRNTQVNLNTAAPEVIAAVMGVDLGTAQRLVEARRRKRFETQNDVQPFLPPASTTPIDLNRVSFTSNYFYINGRLRLGDRVIEEVTLVRRNGREVLALQRERHSSHLGGR
jgi:general secretion pathway protein K